MTSVQRKQGRKAIHIWKGAGRLLEQSASSGGNRRWDRGGSVQPCGSLGGRARGGHQLIHRPLKLFRHDSSPTAESSPYRELFLSKTSPGSLLGWSPLRNKRNFETVIMVEPESIHVTM